MDLAVSSDLQATCSALGTWDGLKYDKEEDCLECLKDLIRYLRRDDTTHEIRRQIGEIQVVQSDLIHILRDHHQDHEVMDMTLRLLVNLTNPELLLYREELPEDKTARNHYLQLQTHRQKYKEAFVDDKLWAVLSQILGDLLKKDFESRGEDDQLIVERILILIRNILQVPSNPKTELRTEDDASIHDQILWVMHKSGIEDLLLFIASSDDELQYCLHVLEIISLMFKEQDPSQLASANFQRSKAEKESDVKALVESHRKEEELRKQKLRQSMTTRHSRFGGTFVVQNVKSISERNLICHKPLSDSTQLNFDKAKRPKKIAKNRLAPADTDIKRRSTLAIRLFLKEFCIEFLNGAYNSLMFTVKDSLHRQKAQQNDETYYLWAMKFFMEFNRQYKFRVELVTETLSKYTFHYIQQLIEGYKDNFEHEKKNRPKCLIWARRMHLAIGAYKELLLNLVAMDKSENPDVQKSSLVLKSDVFYESEYRELCLQQLSMYAPEKMSKGYLKDLVETTHIFLKILEHMAKGKHLIVGKKKRKITRKKKSKKEEAAVSEKETAEKKWDEISSLLSEVLQGKIDLPTDVVPFDAASEESVDDQKVGAMIRIQDCLRSGQAGEAVALMRAAREIWPENDSFGAADADPEDEFMALREIILVSLPRKTVQQAEEEEVNEDPLDREELEEEEEEEESAMTVVSEQEFDFKSFVFRFAIKNVCAPYALLFSNYSANSSFTNHCIIKMFHRIAWDCGLPALLFHVSIFRVFQKIWKDFCLNPQDQAIKDMVKFAKFILTKFREVAEKNSKVYMELCFWKTATEASEIVDGYGTHASSARQKASFWSEEDEEKLERVFHQFKEMEANGDGPQDILDSITLMFEGSGKSRRQIIRKLKDTNLIQSTKEISKKPVRVRPPREWGEDEIEELRRLYEENKEAMDPVGRIIDHMTVKRPKKRIVDKIIELGLCDNPAQLRKKKTRRSGKEGTHNDLQEESSESDSALEDSSSEDEREVDQTEAGSGNALQEFLEDIRKLKDEHRSGLDWIATSLTEEAEDRESEEAEDDVPLVPISEEAIAAMNNAVFKELLRLIEMSPPSSEQEQYWRIPASLSASKLKAKAEAISKALGDESLDDVDGSQLFQKVQAAGQKKKKKRGPNKWLPMRRPVNPDVSAELNKAAIASTPKEKKKKQRGTKKNTKASFMDGSSDDEDATDVMDGANEEKENVEPKKRGSRISRLADSSSEEELGLDDDSEGDETIKNNSMTDKKKKTNKFMDDSSDEEPENKVEDVEKENPPPTKRGSRISRIVDDSSSDEEPNLDGGSNGIVANKSKALDDSDNDDHGAKAGGKERGFRLRLDDTSDEEEGQNSTADKQESRKKSPSPNTTRRSSLSPDVSRSPNTSRLSRSPDTSRRSRSPTRRSLSPNTSRTSRASRSPNTSRLSRSRRSSPSSSRSRSSSSRRSISRSVSRSPSPNSTVRSVLDSSRRSTRSSSRSVSRSPSPNSTVRSVFDSSRRSVSRSRSPSPMSLPTPSSSAAKRKKEDESPVKKAKKPRKIIESDSE